MTDDTNLPVPVGKISNVKLAQLAREVAVERRNLKDILADFGLTEEDFVKVQTWPYFTSAVEAARLEWNGPNNTVQRAQLGAATAVEDAIPMVAGRMHSDKEPLAAVVEAGKWLSKVAGIGESKQDGNSAEKFSITINLGDDKKLKFEKDITPTPPLIEQKEPSNEPT